MPIDGLMTKMITIISRSLIFGLHSTPDILIRSCLRDFRTVTILDYFGLWGKFTCVFWLVEYLGHQSDDHWKDCTDHEY